MKKNHQNQSAYLTTWGILFAVFLQGCMTTQPPAFTNRKAVTDWSLSGKIGVVYPNEDCHQARCTTKSHQGSIDWQQQQSDYRIKLSDPFGREVIAIVGNQQYLRAGSPNRTPVQTTPKDFMNVLLGDTASTTALNHLTPQDLSYWVTGRANPAQPFTAKGSGFVQKGFTINSKQWRQTSVGQMPSLITVSKEHFKIRLVIKEWQTLAQ